MNQRAILRFACLSPVVWLMAGCVVVNPSNVTVSGFHTTPRASPPEAPYAGALQKVIHQQQPVAAALSENDWPELADETDDWMAYTRTLLGYADTSHDPARFRAGCTDLLRQMEALRAGAARHDRAACQQALGACNPILDRLSADFPVTGPPRRPAGSSEYQQKPSPPQAAQSPARVP